MTEAGDDVRVNRVGLGQEADSLGVGPHPRGIGHNQGQTGIDDTCGYILLVPAAGLKNDKVRPVVDQPPGEIVVVLLNHRLSLVFRQETDIDFALGDVDTHHVVHGHGDLPCKCELPWGLKRLFDLCRKMVPCSMLSPNLEIMG